MSSFPEEFKELQPLLEAFGKHLVDDMEGRLEKRLDALDERLEIIGLSFGRVAVADLTIRYVDLLLNLEARSKMSRGVTQKEMDDVKAKYEEAINGINETLGKES